MNLGGEGPREKDWGSAELDGLADFEPDSGVAVTGVAAVSGVAQVTSAMAARSGVDLPESRVAVLLEPRIGRVAPR